MAIPQISPYPMPNGATLPPNKATWRVDPARAVLLIHDMQKYFLAPFPADTQPTVDLLRNVTALREGAVRAGVPVVYTAQPGGMTEQQRGLLRDFWGPGMAVSPAHREIVDCVRPADGDTVLTKWRYSAFHRSGLRDLLRDRGRDQLIVCGVYAHVGVLMTACDAFTNDIQTFMVADAVADFTADYHRLALTYAAERCAVTPTTAAVLGWLAAEVAVGAAG
ncbi:isochorismatase family protein [Planosporangium thailandense]|uniref:Isochorismatase family protein n=1 Tax=Planosporangium thailandense TaxID=765197 RepID=A0ABX0XZR4_9ACTN|nr:isochorismatase family protein [Planosporangium thailandense]NJC70700.1 isochorismatase family protein [Planosporangium thailandense]